MGKTKSKYLCEQRKEKSSNSVALNRIKTGTLKRSNGASHLISSLGLDWIGLDVFVIYKTRVVNLRWEAALE